MHGKLLINSIANAKLMSGMNVVAAILSFAWCLTSVAVPYIPTNDADPLEQLSTKLGEGSRLSASSRAMRSVLARDPNNVDLAVRAAKIYLARARSESDPRLLGQAQAALGRWWAQPEPPVPVLLLRATILQTNHDFKNSRADLEQAVKREPNNAQAWLTLATVQQVTGDFEGATASCKQLAPLATVLVATSCNAGVVGMLGQAETAYDAIDVALKKSGFGRNNNNSNSVAVNTWALTLQAELAERQSRFADADRLYRESLTIDGGDAYTIAAYSDFLIDSQRAAEVLSLIPSNTRADVLLLRRAIAAKLLAAPDASQLANDLGQRFAASRARGDRVHLREEARFQLVIKGAPQEALRLALENWRVQKEALDARIVLEAAVAAQQVKSAQEVIAWLDRTHFQGEKLKQLRLQLMTQLSLVGNVHPPVQLFASAHAVRLR